MAFSHFISSLETKNDNVQFFRINDSKAHAGISFLHHEVLEKVIPKR